MSAIPKLQYNNTDSILEVRINNTQKPLKIDTTLECEALYYGYNLIQWAYMILPTSKHRDFLKDLEIIGNNNLKALYLGINAKQERKDKGMIESDFKENKKKESRNDSNSNTKNNKTSTKQSRPKLIGRLATTIIIKDGLWIG